MATSLRLINRARRAGRAEGKRDHKRHGLIIVNAWNDQAWRDYCAANEPEPANYADEAEAFADGYRSAYE